MRSSSRIVAAEVNQAILVTGPALTGRGGVANYYSHILPELRAVARSYALIEYLEIGSYADRNRAFGPVHDQRKVLGALRSPPKKVLLHVNPSMTRKCAIRDGLFVWQARRQGVPVVVFFRGWNQDFESHMYRTWRAWMARTFLQADAIVTLGRVFEKKIRSWGYKGPVFRSTTVVDPIVLNGTVNDRARESTGLSVLFLSRLEVSKGILDILDALEILRRRGLRVRLTIAGEGSGRNSVDAWLNAHPDCRAQVRLTGFVTGASKATLFHAHDLFLLPTFHGEGLPNSILEAMAAGMPVITCDVGAIHDVVTDEENGLYVRPNQPLEIADQIEKLYANSDLRDAISGRNRQMAIERFSVQAVASQLGDIYQSVLSGSSSQDSLQRIPIG